MLLQLLKRLVLPARQTTAHRVGARDVSALDAVVMVCGVDEPIQVGPQTAMTSDLASERLRGLIPARELSRWFPVWLVPHHYLLRDGSAEHLQAARAIVLAKLSTTAVHARPAFAEDLAAWLDEHAQTLPVFADMADDSRHCPYTDERALLENFQAMLSQHCHLIVTCEALRAALGPAAARGISVIEDPYESPEQPMRFAPGESIRLCWFGIAHPQAVKTLKQALAAIAYRFRQHRFSLEFVSGAAAEAPALELQRLLAETHRAFEVKFTVWSVAATRTAITRADVVVLPQDVESGWGRVKSHNRLVEAIRGGRLALASPIPSYVELSRFAWVGEDLAEGLAWALRHPEDARRRIREGQAYVAQAFSPNTIARKWAATLVRGDGDQRKASTREAF